MSRSRERALDDDVFLEIFSFLTDAQILATLCSGAQPCLSMSVAWLRLLKLVFVANISVSDSVCAFQRDGGNDD